MNHDTAESFYAEKPPVLASDGYTDIARLMPSLREPISEAFLMANPALPAAQLEERSQALRAAAHEAGLTSEDLALLVRTVSAQLRSPLTDAQQVRLAQDSMRTLRSELRDKWEPGLKKAAALVDGTPALNRFLAMAPAARSEEAVARMLVTRAQEHYMRGIAAASRAGK